VLHVSTSLTHSLIQVQHFVIILVCEFKEYKVKKKLIVYLLYKGKNIPFAIMEVFRGLR